MNKQAKFKLRGALVMLVTASVFLAAWWRQDDGVSEKAFFYDLREQKLFTARRTSVPPIQGLHREPEGAVRAVVVSTTGNPADKKSWKIAYLEKYSPRLKQQMEAAQATNGSPAIGRVEGLAHRFVKRPKDPEWFPMSSAEAEIILNEWAVANPQGLMPTVCTP